MKQKLSWTIVLPVAFLFFFLLKPHLSNFHLKQTDAQSTVNDITRLNPIVVNKVIVPEQKEEIIAAIREFSGPISIGGGRYSMGGQIATEGSLHIDMRSFNKILKLEVENRRLTVQAGVRWRDILEAIDKHQLSIKIMQTYSNFTVGGSLSVNAHGRYIGEGALIRSVESLKIVTADGIEHLASRSENQDLFYGAIGGYGGIGVITEATLILVPNEKIERWIVKLPVEKYKQTFIDRIRNNKEAVFHNGDLYPPDYQLVSLETWVRTEKPLTMETRLIPGNKKYWLEPNAISAISTLPFGLDVRKEILDPLIQGSEQVVWRNYEASYDVGQLEPSTPRLVYTYALQEYFVPVDNFDEFVPEMRRIFQKHQVNVVNVSIRHAFPDSESFLSWSPKEVFSFVIYYKQGTTDSAKLEVKNWTRELIDATLALDGTFYLPYQIHATEDQFKRAYPNSQKYFEIKKKYDPSNKFRNKLWDQYYK